MYCACSRFCCLPASPYNVRCTGLNLVARSQWQGAKCIFMAYYNQSFFDLTQRLRDEQSFTVVVYHCFSPQHSAGSQLLIQRDYTGNISINIEHCWHFIELFPVLFPEKNNSLINIVNSL